MRYDLASAVDYELCVRRSLVDVPLVILMYQHEHVDCVALNFHLHVDYRDRRILIQLQAGRLGMYARAGDGSPARAALAIKELCQIKLVDPVALTYSYCCNEKNHLASKCSIDVSRLSSSANRLSYLPS
ncbi:hypothetical protein EVAR_5764_1 [Eumeta japonica]|uniref:Uncharacterized protein n=1 Tax=Eumeta variegata TaxID=151549 RepID=A0A4C1T7S2_EUMVA|nr:hypothetical protein EVAR_5764_1 [Eumeta japonica]